MFFFIAGACTMQLNGWKTLSQPKNGHILPIFRGWGRCGTKPNTPQKTQELSPTLTLTPPRLNHPQYVPYTKTMMIVTHTLNSQNRSQINSQNRPKWAYFDLILVYNPVFDLFSFFFSQLCICLAFLTHPAKG